MPKAKVAQAFALPLLVSLLCGAFLVSTANQPKKGECEASEEVVTERNILSSRAAILMNPSNEPCEDRFNCYQFKNLDGYYQAVFDGHGGWQVSELAMKKMHIYIDEELKKSRSKGDKEISQAIINGF